MVTNDAIWLPGVPVAKVQARYRRAPGKELEGKFASPESSANLVANAFGWFMGRPTLLPPFPGCADFWPATDVCVERCMRLPWRGGLHPWLDVVVETRTVLLGIESKRYEPFRPKAASAWSDAYWRDKWGARMGAFQRMRDDLRSGERQFKLLDAAQLVKHAFGLRTQVCKDASRRAVLFYVYAEPRGWPDGRPIAAGEHEQHRKEVADFAAGVAGDEVTFHSASYAEVIAGWMASRDEGVGAHAQAVLDRYDLG